MEKVIVFLQKNLFINVISAVFLGASVFFIVFNTSILDSFYCQCSWLVTVDYQNDYFSIIPKNLTI